MRILSYLSCKDFEILLNVERVVDIIVLQDS